MIILVLGIALFVFYLLSEISRSSRNPQSARHILLAIMAFICIVLDVIAKGAGTVIFLLFLLGYGWFKLYDKLKGLFKNI